MILQTSTETAALTLLPKIKQKKTSLGIKCNSSLPASARVRRLKRFQHNNHFAFHFCIYGHFNIDESEFQHVKNSPLSLLTEALIKSSAISCKTLQHASDTRIYRV